MYSKQVLEHFKNPKNQGKLLNPDAMGQVGNPVCGDIMKLYLNITKDKKDIEKSKIKEIKFETLGCGAAIACSSVVTQIVKGKTLEFGINLDKKFVLKELGGLPETKVHCSMLSIEALQKAINNYLQKNNDKNNKKESKNQPSKKSSSKKTSIKPKAKK